MADVDSYIKPQRLVSKKDSQIPPNQATPSKFSSRFLYKALLVVVLLVVLPLFPSQAPEFINQTVLTRSWELLQLLFVGIAVSYGLFSRRNVETDKENHSKIDTAHNYVSKILQVSSVFDDEGETPSGYDENKIQTWSSQCHRGVPMVMVAKEKSVHDEQSITSSKTCISSSNKPLLLPVRSLRSQASDSDVPESINESRRSPGSLSRSSSGSKGFYNSFNKTRSGEVGGLDPEVLEEKLKETVVLPSPIPWRSRSGRMEMREQVSPGTPPLYSLPPSVEDSEFDRLESRSFRSSVSVSSSRPSSATSSPKKLSPSPALSAEIHAKNIEDSGRKKTIYKSSPPPPPPPPPPFNRKSPLINAYPSPKRSFEGELEYLSRTSPFNRKSPLITTYPSPKRSFEGELEDVNRTHMERSSVGKSVREVRPCEPVPDMRKTREIGEKRYKDVEAVMVEKSGRKMGGYDPVLVSNVKQTPESTCLTPKLTPKPTLNNYEMEDEEDFADIVMVESDVESDGETDDIKGVSENEEASPNHIEDGITDPNEVDKKADEFIAKFREQIRLQRIESIKKSSGQHRSRNSSR